MSNLEELKTIGTADSVGKGANKKKKRKLNRILFQEGENYDDISDDVLESHAVNGQKQTDEVSQFESVMSESIGVEEVDMSKKKKKKRRKRKKSDKVDKLDIVLEAPSVNGQKQLDELNPHDSVISEGSEVKKNKNKKRKIENDNTDKSDDMLESHLVNGQNQSDELNQRDSVIPENNEVENAVVPKKKRNKRRKKKKNDNTDASNVVLETHSVDDKTQVNELSKHDSVISGSNEVENADMPKKKRNKRRKKKKNNSTDISDVLESAPVNGHKQPEEPKSVISESSVGLPKKKKRNRKRKKGKNVDDSGYVGGDNEEEDGSQIATKRMKVASETSGESSAVLAVPSVAENSESVTSKKKRKKNKRRKATDDVDVEEIKEVSDEPEVKRLKVDTESNLVNSSNEVLTADGNNMPLSLSSESLKAVKKSRKKRKKKRKGVAVVSEIQEEIENVADEQEKVEVANKEQEETEIASDEQEEIEIASEEQEKTGITSEEQEETKVVREEQEETEITSEDQEKTEIASEEHEKILSPSGKEENESTEKDVVEEQEKMEDVSKKQESELEKKTEDVSEEQEEIDLTSEKEEEITILSESGKHEEKESSEKQGEIEMPNVDQDVTVTSMIEENSVKKKKKKKEKKAAESEVTQDVTEEETVIPLEVINKEADSVSETQETADTDNVEESKSAKKKKKKKKKGKGSLEDVQSASKVEENKAEEDSQSADKQEKEVEEESQSADKKEKEDEGDSQSLGEVEDVTADSKKKKKRKKKKKERPEEADQPANSAGWTVSNIKDPSLKEIKDKDGINKSSKIIDASQSKEAADIHTPVNLSEMYINPPMKDEITRCWTEGSPLQRDNGFELHNQPFKCSYMPDFLGDTDILQKVKEELSGIDLHMKNNDLYKFHQTPDLKSVSSPHIARLREFLYGDFRKWLCDITGIELNDTVAMGSSRYGYTDTLLCHDDELEGRRVAYILYLTPPWYEKDGGTLDLYDVDNKGQPRDIVKSLQPKWNTFAFFEVSPVSFHQVREVLSKDKVRLSINGWFHGTNIERPPRHVEVPRSLMTPVHFEEDELYAWINPSYLDSDTQRNIRKKFQNDSEIELESFICEEKYQELTAALQSSQLKWRSTGPANKQSCKVLKQGKLPDVIAGCSKFLKSEALFLILSQLTGLKLHRLAPPDSDPDSDDSDEDEETKDSNPGMTLDIRQWSHGCYTLLRDSDQGEKASALDATFFINVDDKWSLEHGGFTSYIAKDEDEELLTVMPRSNCFALVYRDAETLKFTKYINASVKELGKQGCVFYDFNCTYKE